MYMLSVQLSASLVASWERQRTSRFPVTKTRMPPAGSFAWISMTSVRTQSGKTKPSLLRARNKPSGDVKIRNNVKTIFEFRMKISKCLMYKYWSHEYELEGMF